MISAVNLRWFQAFLFYLFVLMTVCYYDAYGSVVEDNCDNAPRLYFLFLEERKFINTYIWESFFKSGKDIAPVNSCVKHQVFIHANTQERFVGPHGLNYKLVSNKTSGHSCENTFQAMNSVLSEAVKYSPTAQHKHDIFLFLSSDFIPIKPLHEIYSWFYSPSNTEVQSSFCILPTSDWETTPTDQNTKIVRHSPYFALTRSDALTTVNKRVKHTPGNSKFCADEHWYFSLIFGRPGSPNGGKQRAKTEADVPAAGSGEAQPAETHQAETHTVETPQAGTRDTTTEPTDDDDPFLFHDNTDEGEGEDKKDTQRTRLLSSSSSSGGSSVDDSSSKVTAARSAFDYSALNNVSQAEQGFCHTYTVADKYYPDSVFLHKIHLGQGTIVKNSVILNPRLEFLSDLRKSRDFFFLRKIHSGDANTHVRGTDNDDKLNLIDVLQTLQVLNAYNRTSVRGHGNGHNHTVVNGDGTTTATEPAAAKKPKYKGAHIKFRRASGDKHGLKVLMVSIDNRNISPELSIKDYVSMTAVLQNEYCKYNGYDYINMRTDDKALEESVREKFPEVLAANERSFGDKYGRAAYHVGYKYFRASSWGKLPPLWFLAKEYGHHYDYIWFVDSDATPNPVYMNISLGDALEHWKTNSDTMIYRGLKDPYESLFLFMSNFPWRDDLPCAGTFIFKPVPASVAILQEWWDYDIPPKNFDDFMEQDALWYTVESPPDYGFLMNNTILSLLKEPQFPSNWFGVCDLWLVHIPNYDVRRNQYFKTMLKFVNKHTPEAFKLAIEQIQRHNHMSVNSFEIAEEMETFHVKPYRTQYMKVHQPNGGRADDNFHMPDWGNRPPQPPQGTLYNGFILQQANDRAIYLIENNQKRAFPNMETLVKMGYDMEMVLAFNNKGPVGGIPTGQELPAL